jgi:OHCU decarboxylase
MMTIGLHCRLIGRPGRFGALKRFIEYVKSHDKVWLARRVDIARHWRETHPYKAAALRPSRMEFEEFVHRFGGIFEHSPWIAERAYELELGRAHDTAGGLHNALCRVFRAAGESERLEVLKAHPDLAGRLAAAKRLTPASAREQASAGLDALTDKERELFSKLNAAYVTTFGFPFIIAVKGKTKDEILHEFEQRIGNSRAVEFETACAQVERIALLRLKDILPQ